MHGLAVQAKSASNPPWDGKWVVAYKLQCEGLVWLIGAVVCLLASNRGSNCSFTWAMDGRLVHCGIISSCQSAATSEIVKTLLATNLSHVRSTIATTGLYFYFHYAVDWRRLCIASSRTVITNCWAVTATDRRSAAVWQRDAGPGSQRIGSRTGHSGSGKQWSALQRCVVRRRLSHRQCTRESAQSYHPQPVGLNMWLVGPQAVTDHTHSQ